MMIKKYKILAIGAMALFLGACQESYDPIIPLEPTGGNQAEVTYEEFLTRAEQTFENTYNLYWSEKAGMMFGSYPNSLGTPAEPASPEYNTHAYVWGYGAVVSAYTAIAQTTSNLDFRQKYEADIKNTLDKYYSTQKNPNCFACFVNGWDNRLYDDAIWVGIDMADLYILTHDNWYLDKAKSVYQFMLSGMDDKLEGGVYWSEDDKDSKNTCVNAPGTVMCLKLYKATGDEQYLEKGKELYAWTKEHLQDPTDLLYFDNIKLDGSRGTAKFSYNSGQMLQAATLLFTATDDNDYLNDAIALANASYGYFFTRFSSPFSSEQFNVIKDGHRWFNAVMVRGFAELNKVVPNPEYTNAIYKTLAHAWEYTRDEQTGLFFKQFTGTNNSENGDVLQQFAMVELFARMSTFK